MEHWRTRAGIYQRCLVLVARRFQRITTLGTPTATTITPGKTESSQGASSTVKANVTASEPTYGAIAQGAAIVDVAGLVGFPDLSGWFFQPTPEERNTFSAGDSWGLRLLNAMTSADLCVEVVFLEQG